MSPTFPSSGTPRPPRQARAVATREVILEAAASEFAVAGYHGASLARILERSGVTKGALYFHFASKEAMAFAVADEMERAYRAVVERASGRALDPLRAAAHLALDVLDVLVGSPCVRAGQRLAGEGAVGPEKSVFPWIFWQDTFGELFGRAKARGLVRPEVDAMAMGRFVTDISGGAFTSSMAVSGMADLAERVRHNWDLMFTYMAVPEWTAQWRAEGGMATVMARHLDRATDGDR